MARKAIIIGVTGQDGAYLAKHLIELGYEVVGTSRDADNARLANLERLGVLGRVTLVSMDPRDFRSIIQVVTRHRADEMYNLSGQSSVALSFEQPVETLESIGVATLNLLEALRLYAPETRFYNASSSECFGNVASGFADERTAFHPRSPYAVAKAQAFWEVDIYRQAYGLFACSGILYNHESPLRQRRFVTRKVAAAAARIAKGSAERLSLGNTAIIRDWGWAPEYVVAMHAMLVAEKPGDYVVATGKETSLEQFVAAVFSVCGLDWREHVDVDRTLFRPSELHRSVGNPSRAAEVLRWAPASDWREVAKRLAEHELSST